MSPVTSTNSPSAASPTTNAASTSAAASASVNEDSFLQLLVAELQNQDPSNPADGTQFVTQLAEFQQLTTSMNMNKSIDNIQTDADQLVTIAGGTPSSAPQGSNGTSGTQS